MGEPATTLTPPANSVADSSGPRPDFTHLTEPTEAHARMRGHIAGAHNHMTSSLDEFAASWTDNPANRAAHHALGQPGKTLRGSVILAACQAVGGNPAAVEPAAAGIEYGHLASLVHDDLIDKDPTRRARPTVWIEFGAPQAIITGDLLFFAAFHALSRCRPAIPADRIVRALETVALSGIDTCFGASLEMTLTGKVETTFQTYLKMAAGKSGSLIRGAAEGGAILGGGTPEQVASLREYGESLGIAFQIMDDVLPYLSDDSRMGKSVLSDLRNRRPTLPVVLAMANGDEDDRSLLRTILTVEDDERLEAFYERTRDCFNRTGVLVEACRLADQYCSAATDALEPLPDNDGTRALHGLVRLARQRSH